MATELQQEIDRLRTLQESYDVIAEYILSHQEKVTVALGAPQEVVWTNYSVLVLDKATNEQSVYRLNADGVCIFSIDLGHEYQLTLPTITGYATPLRKSFAAVSPTRIVNYTYSVISQTETVRILIQDGLTQGALTLLDGETLHIYASDETQYSGVVDGSHCDIEIPYGKVCTLTPPTVSGYRTSSSVQTITTGQAVRVLYLRYVEVVYGMFGVDADGHLYSVEEMSALTDKTIIKYGYYNDEQLNNSTRVTDGNGNGFYWEIGRENIGSLQWCVGNVNFDTVRLPYYNDLAGWKFAGRYMTDKIIEIGIELYPSNANPTPAATACANRSITIGQEEHRGFLLSYDQIHRIATTSRTLWQSFYSALGRTVPQLWSGRWWTSCQHSATDAVSLYNGGFNNNNKTLSANVFCAYDL